MLACLCVCSFILYVMCCIARVINDINDNNYCSMFCGFYLCGVM